MNYSNQFCHPAHDDELQQAAAAAATNNSIATHYCRETSAASSSKNTWQVYTNTYSYIRRAAG